jgi:hypothetical protein
MHWGEGRILNYPPPDVNIDVKARAVAETMTVFFLTDHPSSSGDNLILVDAIALYPDESAPAAIAAPPPTNTPAPTAPPPSEGAPADAALAAAADTQVADIQSAAQAAPAVEALPTETPTATPTVTATPLPTDTPTATPSPTPTATFTPLPTATWTPWPTITPPNPLDAGTLQARARTNAPTLGGGLILLGTLSFSGAGIFGALLLYLRRRR